MLRAVRFAARFGYEIEAETFRAIRRHAKEIQQVSAERIREELTRMLTEGAARVACELMDSCWLLSVVLPEITALHGVQQPAQYHPEGDVWTHTMMMLEGLWADCSRTLAWGVLLHDIGKPATFRSEKETGDRIRVDGHVEVGMAIARKLLGKLRFSNQEMEQILALIENHMRFKDVGRMKPATLKRFVRLPRFEEHLDLHRLDCLSSNRNLAAYEFVKDFVQRTPPDVVRPARLLHGELENLEEAKSFVESHFRGKQKTEP